MSSIDKRKFARNLNNVLIKKDWSQTDLARASGVDIGNINAYANAKCFPHVAVLWDISKALGMTIEELIDGAIEEEEG